MEDLKNDQPSTINVCCTFQSIPHVMTGTSVWRFAGRSIRNESWGESTHLFSDFWNRNLDKMFPVSENWELETWGTTDIGKNDQKSKPNSLKMIYNIYYIYIIYKLVWFSSEIVISKYPIACSHFLPSGKRKERNSGVGILRWPIDIITNRVMKQEHCKAWWNLLICHWIAVKDVRAFL